MSDQDNSNVVRQAYENFKTGDIGTLLGQMSEDVDWRLPDIEGVPFAGARRGAGQVAEFFSTLGDAQDVLSFEPREFVAQGEHVVALGEYKWRVKKNGREYGGGFAHVFTVRGGKIVAFHEYMDTASAADAYK
ncbi:MAG TPA: nuclear transport factor 2 family protein [Pyrinomonadaceae bacterium]|jgi:ketosteroid isomerase-like protein|nr:nuclear transport factor 2 family protein [Pyrinomonadaceae bacterium]